MKIWIAIFNQGLKNNFQPDQRIKRSQEKSQLHQERVQVIIRFAKIH